MLNKFNHFLFVFFFLLAVPTANYAMYGEEDGNEERPSSLQSSLMRHLPREMVISVAEFLYGKDFQNFSLVCNHIRSILITNEKFLIPEGKTSIIQAIQKTHMKEIPKLILNWARTPKKTMIPILRCLSSEFDEYHWEKEKTNLKLIKKSLKNHTKFLNILYGLGDISVKENFDNFYEKIQTDFHSTEVIIDLDNQYIPNPEKHIVYFKVFANLSPCVREALSKMYQQGKEPFEKSEGKSKKYSRPLNLPLSASSFY